MVVSRRFFSISGACFALTACAPASPVAPVVRAPAEPRLRPLPNAGFDTWLAGFRSRAAAVVLEQALPQAGYLPGVLERDRAQTETAWVPGEMGAGSLSHKPESPIG